MHDRWSEMACPRIGNPGEARKSQTLNSTIVDDVVHVNQADIRGSCCAMIRVSRPALLILSVVVLIALHQLLPHASSSDHDPSPGRRRPPLRAPPSAEQTAASTRSRPLSRPSRLQRLSHGVDIDSKGLTSFVPGEPHPILGLIERGQKLHDAMESKIQGCESLENAVEDYTDTFSLRPPRGFERWYDFTTAVVPPAIPLASLYPWAHEPMLSFLSLSTDTLRKRTQEMSEHKGTFTLTFVPDREGDEGTECLLGEMWEPVDAKSRGKGRVMVRGEGSWGFRCKWVISTCLVALNPQQHPGAFAADPAAASRRVLRV